jgi:S1-C subfamily serine protease
LRRITLGGLWLVSLPEDARNDLQLPGDQLALRVKHVGQYGDHAVAKRAGFLKDDILIAIDGDRAPLTESALVVKLLQTKRPADRITATVLRGSERLELSFAQQ